MAESSIFAYIRFLQNQIQQTWHPVLCLCPTSGHCWSFAQSHVKTKVFFSKSLKNSVHVQRQHLLYSFEFFFSINCSFLKWVSTFSLVPPLFAFKPIQFFLANKWTSFFSPSLYKISQRICQNPTSILAFTHGSQNLTSVFSCFIYIAC